MGLKDKFKKKSDTVIQQDLSKQEKQGSVFIIRLLMKEKCMLPAKELMTSIMEKHLGDVDCFNYDTKMANFAVNKYSTHFKDGSTPPQLILTECMDVNANQIDEITMNQMWDCENSEAIISECKYQVIVTDMLAGGMDYKERADMLMDFLEALVELYPQCKRLPILKHISKNLLYIRRIYIKYTL